MIAHCPLVVVVVARRRRSCGSSSAAKIATETPETARYGRTTDVTDADGLTD
jgi:hypothetical protein